MVSHWETGRYNLPLDDFKAMQVIAKVFQVTVVDLLVVAGYEFTSEQLDDISLTLTPRERRLIKAARSGVLKDIMEAALEIEEERSSEKESGEVKHDST